MDRRQSDGGSAGPHVCRAAPPPTIARMRNLAPARFASTVGSASLAALASLAACASGPDVSLQDHGIFLPTMRFDYSTAQTQSPTEPRARNSGVGGELTGGRGSFAGGDGEYELVSVQGWMYLATPRLERLRAGALLGLEYLGVDLEQRAVATEIDDGGSFGVLVGFDLGYEFVDRLEVYAHGTATALLPPSSSLRGELGLRWRPAPPLETFLGYRWWRLQREEAGVFGVDSDLDLHTDGVVVGFGLVF